MPQNYCSVKLVNVIQVGRNRKLIKLICLLQACKYALRQASPLLGAEKINAMMQDHLIDAGSLQYPDFIADLVKIIVICVETYIFCRFFINFKCFL
jgi:hypothetical protein